MNVQDQTDESVTLTVCYPKGLDFGFTSAEMALGIDYLSERYITRALKTLSARLKQMLSAVLPSTFQL